MSEALARFGAVILAAGQSSRMGGPNKLLEPYRDKPLVCHALECVAGLGLGDAVCVTGRDREQVEALARRAAVRFVHNRDFASGMGASIAAAARALKPGLDGIFIVLGDMPEVKRDDFQRLAGVWREGRIAVPVHGGRRGHPVLFSGPYRAALEALRGDEGARSILRAYAAQVTEAAVDHPGVLFDCDTPQDFPPPGCQ